MYGMRPRVGRLQLAIGESICVSQTRKPVDYFPVFRSALLSAFVAKRMKAHLVADHGAS